MTTPNIFLASNLSKTTLLGVGTAGALVVTLWSFYHWRAAVKMALVVALLEGALRKWLFPQGQELVYFLKDVFLFGAYLKFFLAPDLDVRSHRLRIPTGVILALCGIVAAFALNPNINSAIISVFGLKAYFYYLPLLFMMPFLFLTEEELIKQMTRFTLIALPICLLGLAQWQAGPESILSVYAQRDGDRITADGFGFGMGDRARITSTFSYLTGHATFIVFFVTLCLVMLTLREARWKWIIAWVVLPLLAVNALMGGSRSSLYTAAFIIAGMSLPAFAGRIGQGTPIRTILISSMATGGIVISYWFYEAFFYMSTRAKYAGETLYERTIGHTHEALSFAIEKAGWFGYGLGLTHPATASLKNFLGLAGPAQQPVGVEAEAGNVWMEVGAFGFVAWYAFRFLLVWLCWRSYTLARTPVQKSFALAAFLLSLPYLSMQVVMNHTASILLFAFCGLAMLPTLEPLVMLRHRRPQRTGPPSRQPAHG